MIDLLLEATTPDRDDKSHRLGVAIGKLYTDHGLPIDMALGRLEGCNKRQKVAILSGAQSWLVEHKHRSGATDKAIERQRKANKEAMQRYINTGESGVY